MLNLGTPGGGLMLLAPRPCQRPTTRAGTRRLIWSPRPCVASLSPLYGPGPHKGYDQAGLALCQRLLNSNRLVHPPALEGKGGRKPVHEFCQFSDLVPTALSREATRGCPATGIVRARAAPGTRRCRPLHQRRPRDPAPASPGLRQCNVAPRATGSLPNAGLPPCNANHVPTSCRRRAKSFPAAPFPQRTKAGDAPALGCSRGGLEEPTPPAPLSGTGQGEHRDHVLAAAGAPLPAGPPPRFLCRAPLWLLSHFLSGLLSCPIRAGRAPLPGVPALRGWTGAAERLPVSSATVTG